MYILTVHYPKSEGATFDFEYFRSTHVPAVGKAFGPFGLGYGSVLRGEQSIDGGEPAFFATMILSFPTEQNARDAVASDAGKAALADAVTFTNVTPLMQFDSAVE
jgi:uncharacterized protein (TIGR02118 family)